MIEAGRISTKNKFPENSSGKYVLYMMQASQRINYNHALEYAVEIANRFKKPLIVAFAVIPYFPSGNTRHYRFMFEGIVELQKEFKKIGILFAVKLGNYEDLIIKLSEEAVAVITDKGYLRYQRDIREKSYSKIKVKVFEIESDVVVPIKVVSIKKEPYARTIRNKIFAKIDDYLKYDFKLPELINKNYSKVKIKPDFNTIDEMEKSIRVEKLSDCSKFFKGGYREAIKKLDVFLKEKIFNYIQRSNPSVDYGSNLSPYLHFGQISPVEVIKKVISLKISPDILNSFIDEIVVWRELARNFVTYDENYDNLNSIPPWALKELKKHSKDKKAYVYDVDDFENSKTHDPYWNSAQKELVITGKIHNYMRMYWGKKIIEWSRDYKTAYEIMIYLNDKYAIDGRDPNGYMNISWCFGNFDRPFFSRPVFGRIRYMSENGLKRKFDMNAYLDRINKI